MSIPNPLRGCNSEQAQYSRTPPPKPHLSSTRAILKRIKTRHTAIETIASVGLPILMSTTNQMNEMNNRSREFTDEFPRTRADARDHLLGQESFEYRPTQEEMLALALEGVSLLFIDCLKGK